MQVNPFNRAHPTHVKDTLFSEKASHLYEGRITAQREITLDSVKGTHYEIDHAIQFVSVNEKIRSAALHHFESSASQTQNQKKIHDSRHFKSLIKVFAGIGLTIAGASSLPLGLPFVTLASMITGIGLTGFGTKSAWESTAASTNLTQQLSDLDAQKALWRNPINDLQQQRREAGIHGFTYVFKNDLKNKLVHPDEVRQMWQNAVGKLLTQAINPHIIFSENLMGSEKLTYAWPNHTLPDMQLVGKFFSSTHLGSMGQAYQKCHDEYTAYKASLQTEKDSLANWKHTQAEAIAQLRYGALQPAERLRDLSIQEANNVYHQTIRPFIHEHEHAINVVQQTYQYNVQDFFDPLEQAHAALMANLRRAAIENVHAAFNSHPYVKAINATYAEDLNMCNFLFAQAKGRVDYHFDTRLRHVEQEFAHAQENLKQQSELSNTYFTKILESIFKSSEASQLHALSIARPAIFKNWNLSNHGTEPVWNDIYGTSVSYQSNFLKDISEDSWNVFWGRNGLGQYSRTPFHSWNKLFTIHSSFPFHQQLFKLQRTRYAITANLFVPRLQVPVYQRPQPVFVSPVVVNPAPTCPTPPQMPARTPPVRTHAQPRPVHTGKATKEQPDLPEPVKPTTESRTGMGHGTTRRR